MPYLRQILYRPPSRRDVYPHTQVLMTHLADISFDQPVTLLTGDNGAGKTTLMEILAQKLRAVRIGGTEAGLRAEAVARSLSCFTLRQGRRARQNFYFTAEDFIKYIDWMEQTRQEARQDLERVEREFSTPLAREYARMPHAGTLAALESRYGANLAERSHGEGFLDFFRSRLVPGGLYLMDEPEGALSYENQYVLALMIRDAAKQACQFILATHSPVLTAIPEAMVYHLDRGIPRPYTYEQLPDIQFLQLFLERRARFFMEDLTDPQGEEADSPDDGV